MNRLLVLFGLPALAITGFLSAGGSAPARADVSAASVAMGGIQFRKETRISLVKERLWISTGEVRAEYEFLNQTNADITSDVAFPLAERVCHPWKAVSDEDLLGYNLEFQVWVEGTVQKYKTESQALVQKHIYTALLQKMAIDITTCGHYQEGRVSDFAKLSKQDLHTLSAVGLVSPGGQIPQWTIRQIYYWTQTFPANRTLHIVHTYKPGVGQSEQIAVKYLDPAERKKDHVDDPELDDSCLDPVVGRKLEHNWAGPDVDDASGYVYQWVDYILKTANNWKGPIKDFELNVEDTGHTWVTSCWGGAVERLGPNHVRVKSSNFSPKQNLHILFLPD